MLSNRNGNISPVVCTTVYAVGADRSYLSMIVYDNRAERFEQFWTNKYRSRIREGLCELCEKSMWQNILSY